jgi:uncharacterized membrane protein YbhN (UPF0104 family)
MNPSLGARLKTLLRIKILIPILLAGALLGFVLGISDLPKVIDNIRSIPLSILAGSLGLAGVYLLLKGLVFHLFLRELGLRVAWRRLVLAYAVGELAITIPSGVYAQNYVLQKIDRASFARSAAATTAMLMIEGMVILLTLSVLSIPGWPWLRPAMLAMLGAAVVVLTLLRKSDWIQHVRVPHSPRRWLRKLMEGSATMVTELRRLFASRAVIASSLLTGCYLLALVATFANVAHGVGVPGLTLPQAATIYLFSLGVVMTFGSVLTQLGAVEVVGLGAAQAWGYGTQEALTMMIGFRLVWTGAIWLLSFPPLVLLRSEFAGAAADDAEESPH